MKKLFVKVLSIAILFSGMALLPSKVEAKRVVHKKVVVKHKRYQKHPAKGVVVVNLKSPKLVHYRKKAYYRKGGIYYVKSGRGYKVVAAPVGFRVKVLPAKHVRVVVRGRPYFYYYGTYYVAKGNEYEVVLPPVGLQVDDLPEGYEVFEIDGKTFFVVDGVYYKQVELNNGEVLYEVVKTK